MSLSTPRFLLPLFTAALVAALGMPVAAAPVRPRTSAGDAEAGRAVVDAVVALMALAERLGQLNQPPGVGNNPGPAAMAGSEEQVRQGQIGSWLGTEGAELTCRLQ